MTTATAAVPDNRCSVSHVIQAADFAMSRISAAPTLYPSIQQAAKHPFNQKETIHVSVNTDPNPDRRN
jgi:hypothetical protein